jgi:hypothetical protein
MERKREKVVLPELRGQVLSIEASRHVENEGVENMKELVM